MKALVRRFMGPAVALAMLLSLAGPAAAYEIVSDSGPRGEFMLVDTADMPGGRCGYSAENMAGVARFRWLRVRAPQVFAADRNADQRDSRIVGWSFKIQRLQPGGAWTNVAASSEQRARAYQDAAANLDPKKVYFHGTNDGSQYRALVIIKWYKPNGSVEGKVKLLVSYYGVKWTVGTPDYVYSGACAAAAD